MASFKQSSLIHFQLAYHAAMMAGGMSSEAAYAVVKATKYKWNTKTSKWTRTITEVK
jgi:hypothetical protein